MARVAAGTAESPPQKGQAQKGQALNLVLATAASVVGFWAWNAIATLSTHYANSMELSAGTMSILVAMPIFVGSLGRIVVGSLTDKYGGRALFTIVLLATIPTLLLVMLGDSLNSFMVLLAGAFLLGVAGTIFAVGIPFVSAWYPPSRRGFATGVFGAGMGGTALAAFLNPRLLASIGYVGTHLVIIAVLAIMAVLVWFFMKNAPGWKPNTDPVLPKLLDASKLAVTWKMCFLYAVVFGGFVSFATYLPTYLRDVYAFDPTSAGARTAGFALAAVIARPIGGILADQIGSKLVVIASLLGVGFLGYLVALEPAADVEAGPIFIALAAALGLGTGGVFAWVGALSPENKVGTISGIVSAAGGLGGYFPPLIMGMTYNPDAANYKYAIGLSLLVVTALIALAFTIFFVKTKAKTSAPEAALEP